MRFVDTNVFVRYLTGDDAAKADASNEFFAAVERGDEMAFTSESVIAEIVYVTSSRSLYRLSRLEIVSRLRPVLSLSGINIPRRSVVIEALDVYAEYPQLDFEDALSIAHMKAEGITDLVSYNRDFDRIPDITRLEP